MLIEQSLFCGGAAVSKVCVIGGGASGMAAAIASAEKGDRVVLLEKSNRLGMKVSASGNGRCNLMNVGALRYQGDSSFAHQVLEHCSPSDQRAFWEKYGLLLRQESEGRVYPCTLHSSSVLDALKLGLRMNHAEIRLQEEVTGLSIRSSRFEITAKSGRLEADRVILSTGGPSQPKLGGNQQGAFILSTLGHALIPFRPALCPILTDDRSISGLSGLRVRCTVRLIRNEQVIRSESGEVVFTDNGISGICVMQCARFCEPVTDELELDLAPSEWATESDLVSALQERQKRFSRFSPETLLQGVLMPRLGYAVLKQARIPLRGETADQLDDSDLKRIAYSLRHYRLKPRTIAGFDHAQASAGGADCRFFSSLTMESSLIPGLHVTGELLNVDGDCGGYNLMFAFASGLLAGWNGRRAYESGREG